MSGDRAAVDSTVAVSTAGRDTLSTDAGARAHQKWPHHGRPGTTRLDWEGNGAVHCGGKLLTAYVRVKERFGEPTRWTAVGVVCMGCQVYWPRAVPA
jgi:hypothetical protein